MSTKSYWVTINQIAMDLAQKYGRPFSRVILNRGRFVKYSYFDGAIEHYGN